MEKRPPFPPYTLETATEKVRAAEGWMELARSGKGGARLYGELALAEPDGVCDGAGGDCGVSAAQMGAGDGVPTGEGAVGGTRRTGWRVRFCYEFHDAGGQWFRAYGSELWEFDENGLMRARHASINDLAIFGGGADVSMVARAEAGGTSGAGGDGTIAGANQAHRGEASRSISDWREADPTEYQPKTQRLSSW